MTISTILEIHPFNVKTLVINFVFEFHCPLAQLDETKKVFLSIKNQRFQNRIGQLD